MAKRKLPHKDFAWSPKLAYAIGLLATDGNLSKDGRHITLRSIDIDQLETFKKCLNLKNPIGAPHDKHRPNICYRLQFSNVQFFRWLLTIGLFPAKTYTLGIIKIPDQFFRDFLRGHLDGDGTITTYQDHYNTSKHPDYVYTRLFVRFISASKQHINWLRNTIIRLTNLKGDLFEDKPSSNDMKTVSMWQLKFMKKESLKLLPWLYYAPDIPCLNRKRQKALIAIKIIQNIKRKTYTKNLHRIPTLMSPTVTAL